MDSELTSLIAEENGLPDGVDIWREPSHECYDCGAIIPESMLGFCCDDSSGSQTDGEDVWWWDGPGAVDGPVGSFENYDDAKDNALTCGGE